MNSTIDPIEVLNNADCLFTKVQVESALDKMAFEIDNNLSESNPIVICVLTGAIIPMGCLLTRLTFPLEIDYLHATRYKGGIAGGEINWISKPSLNLENRNILLIDDILDEGITLQKIIEYCQDKNVKSIQTAVLINKIHDRKVDVTANYIGLNVVDRYLFGYGMDYKKYLRNAPGIYAVKGL